MPDYRELPSPEDLVAYLDCLWTEVTGHAPSAAPIQVVPDGCIDIVWVGDDAPTVVGPATVTVFPLLPPDSTIVGVRFRPGLAPTVLGVPADEIVNQELPLRDLTGRAGRPLMDRLTGVVDPQARLDALQGLVRARLEDSPDPDALALAAVRWLGCHPNGRAADLADLLGLSERQLRRRFEAAVGYGPKTLQRILRFQAWLRRARRLPPAARRLADLALAAGYADQAHLTREVTRLAGAPPTALLRA